MELSCFLKAHLCFAVEPSVLGVNRMNLDSPGCRSSGEAKHFRGREIREGYLEEEEEE